MSSARTAPGRRQRSACSPRSSDRRAELFSRYGRPHGDLDVARPQVFNSEPDCEQREECCERSRRTPQRPQSPPRRLPRSGRLVVASHALPSRDPRRRFGDDRLEDAGSKRGQHRRLRCGASAEWRAAATDNRADRACLDRPTHDAQLGRHSSTRPRDPCAACCGLGWAQGAKAHVGLDTFRGASFTF